MNKKQRSGVDINVAFRSASKQLRYAAGREDPEVGGPHMNIIRRVANRVRATVRSFAGLVFRVAKPVLRPVFSRFRHYMVNDTHIMINNALVKIEVLTSQVLQLEQSNFQMQGTLDEEILPLLGRIENYGYSTARRSTINCGNDEVIVRTQVGYVVCSTKDQGLLANLDETGDIERGTRLLIEKILSPGCVFVDVGANVGLHSLAAARVMRGGGYIISFEPYAPIFQLLKKTIQINGFSEIVELHQSAVSSQPGEKDLYIGVTSGHNSLFQLDLPKDFSKQSVAVPVVRLDEVISPKQRIDLIKIDVEGAELEVLESGVSLILSNPDIALIVEFGPSHLKRTGHTASAWLKTFADCHLDWKAINPYTGVLESWSIDRLESVESINLFFSRKDSQAWARATL